VYGLNKQIFATMFAALVQQIGFLRADSRPPPKEPIDWSCLNDLLYVAEHVLLDCFGDNPVPGIHVISWRWTEDEIEFRERSPLYTVMFYDCLDPISDAGLAMYAVAWPGADERPVQIAIRTQSYRIAEDGVVWAGEEAVGRLVELGDDHQAFVILDER
jgi:hypothetical protein